MKGKVKPVKHGPTVADMPIGSLFRCKDGGLWERIAHDHPAARTRGNYPAPGLLWTLYRGPAGLQHWQIGLAYHWSDPVENETVTPCGLSNAINLRLEEE